MGRYVGSNGVFLGKVGGIVGSKWRDIYYIRARPKKSTKAPSEAKKASNNSFRFMNSVLQQLHGWLMENFQDYPGKGTGRNSAHSYNFKNALLRTDKGFEIDYSRFLFTWGDLEGTASATAELKAPRALVIRWDPRIRAEKARPEDAVVFLVVFPEKDHHLIYKQEALRKDGEAELSFPQSYSHQRAEVLIAFKSPVSGKVSMSQYVGSVVLSGEDPDPAVDAPAEQRYCAELSVAKAVLLGRK